MHICLRPPILLVFHTCQDSLQLCAKIFVFSLIHQMYAEIQKQKNVPLAGTIDGASDVNIRHVFGLEVTPLSCLPTWVAVRRAARLTTAGTSITPNTCQGRAPAATHAPLNPSEAWSHCQSVPALPASLICSLRWCCSTHVFKE